MIILFILGVSAGVVVCAVGWDVASQIHEEKVALRKAEEAKRTEAQNLIAAGLRMKMAREKDTTIELKVVTLPKRSAHGRHRLVAA